MKHSFTRGNIGAKQLANLKAQLAAEAPKLEREIRLAQTKSTPRGRTYRIGKISRASKKNLEGIKVRSYKTKSGKTRYIVGSKFYRASAKGQPPAVRFGGLLNATKHQKINIFRWRVFNSKKYAGVLDSPLGLDRPFFASTVAKFRPGYIKRLKAALRK